MSERKVTDILIELESKIDELLRKVSSQDLLLKAQTIKINDFLNSNKKEQKKQIVPKITEAAVDPIIKVDIQQPPSQKVEEPVLEIKEPVLEKTNEEISSSESEFSITQRVIDSSGRAIYLAAIDVINLTTQEKIKRVTTKSNGKFSIKLVPGTYRFKISKQTNLRAPRIESIEDITVIGDINLPDFILK